MLTVTAAGSKSFELSDFTLSAETRLRENIAMSVGQNNETVEVIAAPPSLDAVRT